MGGLFSYLFSPQPAPAPEEADKQSGTSTHEHSKTEKVIRKSPHKSLEKAAET